MNRVHHNAKNSYIGSQQDSKPEGKLQAGIRVEICEDRVIPY